MVTIASRMGGGRLSAGRFRGPPRWCATILDVVGWFTHGPAADVQENEIGMSSSSLELRLSLGEARGRPQSSPLLDPRGPGPDPRRAPRAGAAGRPGAALAAACTLAPRRRVSSPLLRRFVENRRVLIRARREILGHDRPEVQGIDAEWLADNFHIVEEVLREVRQDLPRGYDEELPKLAERARWRAIPGSTPWPWRWSPTPTASSTRPGSPGSSRRSRRSRR